jgi:hypothetical protein
MDSEPFPLPPSRQDEMTAVVREALRLDRTDAATRLIEQAENIRQLLLNDHLPRIIQGLRANYSDENLMLAAYGLLVRHRTLLDTAHQIEVNECPNTSTLS